MAAPALSKTGIRTIADLLEELGSVSPARVRFTPYPATESDLLRTDDGMHPLCELVDGVLVEKAVGYYEAVIAAVLIAILAPFVRERKLGVVAGADGMLRLRLGLVRIPDVSFVAWERLPDRKLPKAPIPRLAPDLAVEVLSEGNTPGEMARKLREYLAAGARLVWYIDPDARTITAYTSPEDPVVLSESDTLDGGKVLPGFSLPAAELFRLAGERAAE